MYNDISEILIKAARSASQATVLELIKQANNQSYMTKSAVGAGVAAKVLLKKLLPGALATAATAGGVVGVERIGEHYGRNQMRERYENEKAEQKRQAEWDAKRNKDVENARNEGSKAGREAMANEIAEQQSRDAERKALIEAGRRDGFVSASEADLKEIAKYYTEHPELPVPPELQGIVNSRSNKGFDLGEMLSNNKFMVGGGLAGAGIGYGLSGEDTKSKVLGTLLGGSLGGGLGALVDNYVK